MSYRRWFSLEGPQFERDADQFRLGWLIATATYRVGDLVTTVAVGLLQPGIQEANPLMREAAKSLGSLGVGSLKLAVNFASIGVSVYFARNGDERRSYPPPAVLTLTGSLVTVHNLIGLAGDDAGRFSTPTRAVPRSRGSWSAGPAGVVRSKRPKKWLITQLVCPISDACFYIATYDIYVGDTTSPIS